MIRTASIASRGRRRVTAPPVIRIVRPGEFDKYRRRMVEQGRADGQFKILWLTSDSSFAAEFEAERDLVGGGRSPALLGNENALPTQR
jgi:hypothetical protein